MITLKELVAAQQFTEVSDIYLIKQFFEQNDMEEEGMDLIHELTKTKVAKMKHREDVVKTWTSALPSKYLYENYDLDTADFLHTLELAFLSYGCELSDGRLEQAKEKIPEIKMPKVYFRPLIEYLDSKDIRFKGEKPIEHKRFM